jgi:predicted TIM-barrel fold metal-dependent hydrolase
MAYPAQLADLADLARRMPETPLVVGHTGMPLRRSAREHDLWRDGMARLAALPHVTVKISGLGMTEHHWSVASIRPLVEETIRLFTPARCMFASNFPVDGLHATYDQVWDAFDEITTALPDAVRQLLFRETARRVYRIP